MQQTVLNVTHCAKQDTNKPSQTDERTRELWSDTSDFVLVELA